MKEEISVRQWQEQFQAGAFNSPDLYVQCRAGWYDWFCRDNALAGRLKKIGRVVMGVTSPFLLDNFYVWFKNNAMISGQMYDDVRFEPLSGKRDGKYFLITLDHPGEKGKWALHTERYGLGTSEFVCANIREMIQYVNKLGTELEKDVSGPPVLEVVSSQDADHVGRTPPPGFRRAPGKSHKKRKEHRR